MSFDNTSVILDIITAGFGSIGSSLTLQTPGRTGSWCLQVSGGGNAFWAVQVFPDNQPKWTVGAAFMVTGSETGDTDLIWVNDALTGGPSNGNTNVQFGCGINSIYGVYAITGTGARIASGNALWRPNAWNYIEVSATIGVSQTLIVRLNGVVVVNAPGVSTQKTSNNTANMVSLVQEAGPAVQFDDVYILDGQDASGGNPAKSANNTFLGDIAVFCEFPNADGHYAMWTPTAGSNFACVDQYAYTDSTYVSSVTAANIDSYLFPATPASSGVIFGVQENVIARKDDAGSRVLAPFYRGGGTDFPITAAELGLSNSYQVVQAEFDNDPATTDTWTQSGLNAGEFGQKMIS